MPERKYIVVIWYHNYGIQSWEYPELVNQYLLEGKTLISVTSHQGALLYHFVNNNV
jgi:hypothetical protein